MEILRFILSHPFEKSFLQELLNGTNPWLFEILSQLNGQDPKQTERDVRKSLEEYLQAQKRLSHEWSRKRRSYKDFLDDEKTTDAAMVYFIKTLLAKFNEPNQEVLVLMAVSISLERMEAEFVRFKKDRPDLKAGEALVLFFGEI